MGQESGRLVPLMRRLGRHSAQPAIAGGVLALGIIALILAASLHLADAVTKVLTLGGTTLFVTGVNLLVSAPSNREATRRQDARDANLRAKKESYEPLSIELKALHRRFEQAHKGHATYPLALDVGDEAPSPRSSRNYPLVAELDFRCWEQCQQDTRDQDFSPQATALLDRIVERIRAYNAAVFDAREATIPLLAAHIRTARQVLREELTPDQRRPWLEFDLQWRERQGRTPRQEEPPLANGWYEIMLEEQAPAQMAATWIAGGFGPSSSPKTLGWLLAQRTNLAAEAALAVYDPGGSFASAPPEWLQGVLDDTWPDLVAKAGYDGVWAAFEALRKDIEAANAMVLTALREIRTRYEGGPPLL